MTRRRSLHIRWRGATSRYGAFMLTCFVAALILIDFSERGVVLRVAGGPTERGQMVENTIVTRGVKDPAVLSALRVVPRERFVRPQDVPLAYQDASLPVAEGRWVWPASTLAVMLETLGVRRGTSVLVVDGGAGYEVAVMAEMGARVQAIESNPSLASSGAARVDAVDGLPHVSWKRAPASEGWAARGPYDVIVVLTVQPAVSAALLAQLAPAGVLLVAVGDDPGVGRLLRVTRDGARTVVGVLALAPPANGHVIPAVERPLSPSP